MNVTMIQDKNNSVELVTFLKDGNILLKIGNRFMLFNDCGNFIDEIEFRMKDSRSEKKRENAIKRMKSTIEYT